MRLSWISVSSHSPYFVTEEGHSWTPIGQNDAIEWPDLAGLFRGKDLGSVRVYLEHLSQSGVTVLRLMLEYCHHEHRYFEKPAGHFAPAMVRLWDDLFALCEEFGLRILLTPFDTFWMWRRWKHHPYNSANGGPCIRRKGFFLEPTTREFVKRRLDFVTQRWGASGVLFAWDLWNELHPAYGLDSIDAANRFVTDISAHLRETETRLFGRAHLQTVSTFLPLAQQRPELAQVIYRHPTLDFASTHFYEEGTIDDPKDTVQPAISTGKLVRAALDQVPVERPFFDSEHGPIHAHKDHHRTLPEPFDNEYFRHIQWAHVASGGAGGAMRWPNRKPHCLTPGMRLAQKSLADFLPSIDWSCFQRRNWNEEVRVLDCAQVAVFACGDDRQGLIWLLRTDTVKRDGMLDRDAAAVRMKVLLPWRGGSVTARFWDTESGQACGTAEGVRESDGRISFLTPVFARDLAIALARTPI